MSLLSKLFGGNSANTKHTDFRFKVDSTFYLSGDTLIITGYIESGILRPGDKVEIVGNNYQKRSSVEYIEEYRKKIEQAVTGQDVGIAFRGFSKEWAYTNIKCGDMIYSSDTTLEYENDTSALAISQELFEKNKSEIDDLTIIFNHHLNAVRSHMLNNEKMMSVLNELEKLWIENYLLIKAKVTDTISDGQLHSTALAGGESDLTLTVYAIPVPLRDAINYFERGTPPTYTEIIGRITESPYVIMARETGAKVLVHIVVCADPNNSPLAIQFCILPFPESGGEYKCVLPTDLLTDAERELWQQ
jgi:hypothetical protein